MSDSKLDLSFLEDGPPELRIKGVVEKWLETLDPVNRERFLNALRDERWTDHGLFKALKAKGVPFGVKALAKYRKDFLSGTVG